MPFFKREKESSNLISFVKRDQGKNSTCKDMIEVYRAYKNLLIEKKQIQISDFTLQISN